MSALTLYKKHSQAELLAMDKRLSEDPASKNTDGGIFIHTPKVRKAMNEIAQAIAWHMEDTRAAKGDPVKTNGYSGRKSNR